MWRRVVRMLRRRLISLKYINNYGAQVSKRSTSYIVNYDSSLYNYYNILNMSDYATKIVRDMLEVCLPMGDTTSFIKLNIWMTILEKYNNANMKMDTLSEAVKFMKDRLKSEDKEKPI